MASRYSKKILEGPTKAIVIENNIWAFGKAKEKAKINIPALMPLQKAAETTTVTKKKTNKKIKNKVVEQTLNYIEIYLPDSIYTYPTTAEIVNDEATIKGASWKNPKRTDDNGQTKKALTRIVRKNTQLMITFIDGIALSDNIKVLGKYDDYEEEKKKKSLVSMSDITISSALGR